LDKYIEKKSTNKTAKKVKLCYRIISKILGISMNQNKQNNILLLKNKNRNL
ncbi:16610_t:CDS:1, partial [Dentiscutata heterogama]